MRCSVTVSLRWAWSVALVSLGVLALAPSVAAAADPVARPSCTSPSTLGCAPCPASVTRCADPTGYVKVGTPVTFDGSASSFSSPATKIATYRWTYPDGSASASSPQTNRTFGTPGTFQITLQVTDDTGAKGVNAITVVVGARLFATPSPSIVLGAGTLSDSARVIGRSGATSNATIDFRLYGPNDALCSGAPVYEKDGVRYPLGDGGTVSSGAFTPTQIGEYRWTVTYGNDSNNSPAPSICAGTTVVSAPPPPPPAPPPGPAITPPPPPASPSDATLGAPVTCAGRTPTITVAAGQHTITGTPGADVIVGGTGDDKIDGRGGADVICGGGGDDEIRGGAGNDRLYGNDGDDLVLGGDGNDYVHGGNGADRLAGQNGNDHVDGAAGNDLLDDEKLGGKGRDELIGGTGGDHVRALDHTIDTVECGTGRDTARIDVHDGQRGCEAVRRGS